MINIERFLKEKRIRIREVNKPRIINLIDSAQNNVDVALSITLNDKNATVIFREIYESIRQLGDAKWWTIGYEPLDHSVSLDSLKDINIKEKVKLNFLERFKQIRHDANYRGFTVSANQGKEIIDFWGMCSKDIIKDILSPIKA